MEILITEHKGTNPDLFENNTVRVFVNNDTYYGYWVNEKFLYDLLSDAQKREYVQDYCTFCVSVETAQKIIDNGHTPYAKPKLKG